MTAKTRIDMLVETIQNAVEVALDEGQLTIAFQLIKLLENFGSDTLRDR